MSSVKKSLLTGVAAAALCGSQASAADYTPPPQQVIYQQVPVPVPVQDFGGWYLRGDIGMSNQKLKNLDNALFATATNHTWLDKGGFTSAPIFGLGIGYQYNDWLRFDVTGEYRGKAEFHALDRYTNGGAFTNDYTATKSEWLFLANAYLDLGTWWCITPFIGAGVGFANITIDHYRDVNTIAAGGGYADSASQTNFAWALHAGLAYKVTPNFTVELAYRYLNLGDGITGDVINFDGTNAINNPTTFKDITSHDLKFGVRWNLQDSTPGIRSAVFTPPPAPVYAQPQQQVITMPQQQVIAAPPQVITAPPPVYAQPQPLYQPQYSGPAPTYQPQPQYAPPPPAWQHQQQPPLMRRG